MHMSHMTTDYPRMSWILIRNYRKRNDKNSTAAPVAFSCTMKALSLSQSHTDLTGDKGEEEKYLYRSRLQHLDKFVCVEGILTTCHVHIYEFCTFSFWSFCFIPNSWNHKRWYYSAKPEIGVIPYFGSGKSGIWPFFRNPATSGSDQISSRIWQMLVQLQYIQLITDYAPDLSSGVFKLLISVTRMIKIQNSLSLHKFPKKNWQTVT